MGARRWTMSRASLRPLELIHQEKGVMKSRNKIASIVLFLAALVVGFDAQPGWSLFGILAPGYFQCDVATGFVSPAVAGMVVLPDGTVLVADYSAAGGGLYSFKPGSTCQTSVKTKLSGHLYLRDGHRFRRQDIRQRSNRRKCCHRQPNHWAPNFYCVDTDIRPRNGG